MKKELEYMKTIRTIAAAFAQYSRIPMPRLEWNEDDMRYSLAAFPLVGAVIALLYIAAFRAGAAFGVPDAALALLMTAVPVAVTGGFHIDGFMDTCDALNSYGAREEKLRILKDPHTGAFAVIRLALAGLVYIASVMTVLNAERAERLVPVLAAGFVLSRALSAAGVLMLKSAKKEGMLYYEATAVGGGRTTNLAFSAAWAVAASAAMVYAGRGPAGHGAAAAPVAALFMITAALLSFLWYRQISYRQFGGITGDTAGYFVVICETAMAAAAAVAALI